MKNKNEEYTLESVLNNLSALGDDKRKEYNKKLGVDDNQFGIPLGKFRPLAKKIKKNHKLAFELWNTRNFEAMILGAMLFEPKLLTENDFETLIKDAYIDILVDELTFEALGYSMLAKEFMRKWIMEDDEKYGRAGWNLAIMLIHEKKLNDDDYEFLLSEVREKMKDALPQKQWAMNRCLCEIGIRHDNFTDRCISIGEELGVYKELKVSKGCTSAYAPEWITVGRAKRDNS